MAVFKCKMCGGALEISEDITVAECEYCGSKQTVPTKNDEVITNLFNRANNLRLKNEFDKAAEVYSKILNENDADAEAHWGLVLCKYGIEYIEADIDMERLGHLLGKEFAPSSVAITDDGFATEIKKALLPAEDMKG